jgi:hypothetical protein
MVLVVYDIQELRLQAFSRSFPDMTVGVTTLFVSITDSSLSITTQASTTTAKHTAERYGVLSGRKSFDPNISRSLDTQSLEQFMFLYLRLP